MCQFAAKVVEFAYLRGHSQHPHELVAAIPAGLVDILSDHNWLIEFGLQRRRCQSLVVEKHLVVEQAVGMQEGPGREHLPNLGLECPTLLLAIPNSFSGDYCFLSSGQQVRPRVPR